MFSKHPNNEISAENFVHFSIDYCNNENKQLISILESNENFININKFFVICFQASLFNYAASLALSHCDANQLKIAIEAVESNLIRMAGIARIDRSVITGKLNTFNSFFVNRKFENPTHIMILDHDLCEHGRLVVGPEMDYLKHMQLGSYITESILRLMAYLKEYKLKQASKQPTILDILEKLPGFNEQKEAYELMAPMCANGVETDELPNAQGNFGHNQLNPIPTHTIFGTISYLAQLQNMSGQKVGYERRGSLEIPAISQHPLDCYAISNPDGTFICDLWFSPYHKKNSNKIPYGFIFAT